MLGTQWRVPSKTRVIIPGWLDSGLTRGCTPYVPNLEHTHSLTRDISNCTERELECDCELSGRRGVMVHIAQHQEFDSMHVHDARSLLL